jgi:hypothetical protein
MMFELYFILTCQESRLIQIQYLIVDQINHWFKYRYWHHLKYIKLVLHIRYYFYVTKNKYIIYQGQDYDSVFSTTHFTWLYVIYIWISDWFGQQWGIVFELI